MPGRESFHVAERNAATATDTYSNTKKKIKIKSSTSLFSISASLLSSVQFSCSVVSDSLRPHESQHARPPCPSPTPGVHPDSRPLSQ